MADASTATLPAPRTSYYTGVILVLLAGAFWSSMGLGIRSMEAANVWQILFYRSIALSLFLFAVISFRSGMRPLDTIRRAGYAGAIGGVGLVFAFSGGIYAIQTTTVANAMFLFASAPFLAAVLGWVILRESVRRATWVSMIFALAGVGIMVADGIATGYLIGNLAAILSAFGFAAFTIALRWGKLEDMMPAVFLAGIFSLFVSAFFCATQVYGFDIPRWDIGVALSMGVFQVGLGLIVFTIGSRSVPAAELALLSLSEVVLGPLWVWLVYNEVPGAYTLLGGAVLMLAIAGNALAGLRRKPVPVM